ncbi:MAG: carboxypeptidase-like regulatory domain-containing protein [Vicinamibacterales bacterium]
MTRTLTLAVLLVSCIFPVAGAGAIAGGALHGVVADQSGGMLPGVSVTAAAEDGRILATAVTDQAGRYAFVSLPDAAVRLTFQLEGFSTAIVDVSVSPDRDTAVAAQRLLLAARSETVTVQAAAPHAAIAPSPYTPAPPPPPPPPIVAPVPAHDRDSICGPAKPDAGVVSLGTIRSRRYLEGNGLYTRYDELLIAGGTAERLAAGQNVVARRTYHVPGDARSVTGEHTAGLLQIVSAGDHSSVAVVIYACDELMQGDWLAPFEPEPVRAAEPPGAPAYDNAARILFADAGQIAGAPGRLMVIDRGRNHGIQPQQRLTLFRRGLAGARRPAVIGDAVVVAVRFDSATIRIVGAMDIIEAGDWAAPQRYFSASRP